MKPKHVWKCFFICYSVGFLFLAVVAGISTSAQAQSEPEWQRQAEDNFYLRPGMADQLMTKHEWEQHWKEMQNMGPQQQAQYRQEWHVKMMQRARKRELTFMGAWDPITVPARVVLRVQAHPTGAAKTWAKAASLVKAKEVSNCEHLLEK